MLYLITHTDDNLITRNYLAHTEQEAREYVFNKFFYGDKEYMEDCFDIYDTSLVQTVWKDDDNGDVYTISKVDFINEE